MNFRDFEDALNAAADEADLFGDFDLFDDRFIDEDEFDRFDD